jgi:hypothetical protein
MVSKVLGVELSEEFNSDKLLMYFLFLVQGYKKQPSKELEANIWSLFDEIHEGNYSSEVRNATKNLIRALDLTNIDSLALKDDEVLDFDQIKKQDSYNFFIRSLTNYKKDKSQVNLEQVSLYYKQMRDNGYLANKVIRETVNDFLSQLDLFNKVVLDGFQLKDDEDSLF